MKPLEIRRAFSGPMAMANFCFPLGAKRATKVKWLNKRSLYLGDVSGNKRILAHVYIPTMQGKRFFLMDAVTGTLYRRGDGRCLTSDQLRLNAFVKRSDLTKKLLKMKVSFVDGDE
jgi:hypothetical protein